MGISGTTITGSQHMYSTPELIDVIVTERGIVQNPDLAGMKALFE